MSHYRELRERIAAREKRAAYWKILLDEDSWERVELIRQAWLRGRITLTQAKRVLGYPPGTALFPFKTTK